MAWASSFGASGIGSKILGSGCKVWGLGFGKWFWAFRFRVKALHVTQSTCKSVVITLYLAGITHQTQFAV